jgi:uncharacterized protein (DUF362 family)
MSMGIKMKKPLCGVILATDNAVSLDVWDTKIVGLNPCKGSITEKTNTASLQMIRLD